jgi:hydroxyacylglutathione hydrolase
VIEPDRIEEAVRDLIRVGLDRIKGWWPANQVAAYAGAGAELATVREIDADAAAPLVLQKRVNVLDVRRASEFEQGHIPEAIHIPHTRLAARVQQAPCDKPLLVNCHSGRRSARAVSLLQRHGFDVMNLKRGIVDWESAHPLVPTGGQPHE